MLNTVIFIGRSGCGKGTQAKLLIDHIRESDVEKRETLYVETGDSFRTFVDGGGLSAKLAREIMDNGGRQPDFLACAMWGDRLINELKEDMHLVFDGVARAIDEAQVLTTALEFYKREAPKVVYLNVSREWSKDRLVERGRGDDATMKKIESRLDWFDKDTLPALEYFRSTPLYKFIEVNGEQPIEKVHQDILAAYA